ncbi:porin [Chthonobacter albigriseus]|uniref:porin n=1 Tax=Chthonobacter albigriseus TaxID=1683161 RepID=UPI0015EF3B10|nr:porin [Chthonobacter albigriseus]
MTIRGYLLGTAAGLFAVTGAQAADLPGEAVPAAVDYVKVCDAFGAGFFYIPGGDTCLKIGGRVRFGAASGPAYSATGTDNIELFASGRVDFDTRSATEYGTLRTFFRITSDGTGQSDVGIDKAFIQLGYFTGGYAATYFDSFGALVGDNDRNFGGETRVQASVLFDNLGGGFYAGIGAFAPDNGLAEAFEGDDDTGGPASIPDIQAIVGISGQPWGSAALGVWYSDEGNTANEGDGFWAVKADARIKATDSLTVVARTYYVDTDGADSLWNIGAGVSFAATDALTINVGAEYGFQDDSDNFGVTAGVDYTVVPGLVATAELSYDDEENGDEELSGLLRLSREW